jgi:hypothetical protein
VNRQDAEILRNAVSDLVNDYWEEYSAKVVSTRYDLNGFCDIKIRISEIDENGVPITKELADLRGIASSYGFDLDKEATHSRLGKIRLVGYKSRARKYPFVVLQVATDKKYSISDRDAERFFA